MSIRGLSSAFTGAVSRFDSSAAGGAVKDVAKSAVNTTATRMLTDAFVGGPTGPAPTAALATTPATNAAQGFLAVEGARTEQEKYDFPPKMQEHVAHFNEKRAANNEKAEHKLADVDAKISKFQAEHPGKEVPKKLLKEREHARKDVKPLIDLARTTAQVDKLMNDPSLTDAQRKDGLESIRKTLDIRKSKGMFGQGGAITMNDLFTGRLGKIDGKSAKNIKGFEKAEHKALDHQLKDTEKTFGKNSVQYKSLKAQQTDASSMLKEKSDKLSEQSKFLKSVYKPPSFFGAIGNFFKKIVLPIVEMIPGVGTAIGLVHHGIEAVVHLAKGDFKGAFGSALSMIPGPGKVAGKVVGGVAEKALGAGAKAI